MGVVSSIRADFDFHGQEYCSGLVLSFFRLFLSNAPVCETSSALTSIPALRQTVSVLAASWAAPLSSGARSLASPSTVGYKGSGSCANSIELASAPLVFAPSASCVASVPALSCFFRLRFLRSWLLRLFCSAFLFRPSGCFESSSLRLTVSSGAFSAVKGHS